MGCFRRDAHITLRSIADAGGPMKRARLISNGMLQVNTFNAAEKQITEAIARGSVQSAKRRIKKLMNNLIETPSDETIDLFVEIYRRWNWLVDTFEFLEAHWGAWATWEDRLEIIWQKFGRRSPESELIQAVYLSLEEIDPDRCGLGPKERLRRLIRRVVDFEQNGRLRYQLIELFEFRYGRVMNVHKYVQNLRDVKRGPAPEPLPPDQMRNFWHSQR